ncbi:MAG: hypothetical protein RLZ98_2121 [Pseudomonadota bacterium]|jgi:protein-tyrosine-phosphatase/predicted ATP-grasp superfamily ATP-dependent carboligase
MTHHPEAPMKSVLVLGHDSQSFLTSIRSFGRRGFAVDIGWFDASNPVPLASRYIRDRIELQRFRADGGDGWLDALNDLVADRQYEFVLPCHDEQILPLQANMARLRLSDRFGLINERAFRLANDKTRTRLLAAELGIPVPDEVSVTSRAGIRDAARAFGFPLYLKPTSSYVLGELHRRREVIRIDREHQIDCIEDCVLAEPLVVQRAVYGRGVGLEFLAREGVLLTAFQHERVHEPASGGGSSYRRSVALDPVLERHAIRMIEALGYTGAGMLEFKIGVDDPTPYLMELNGRLWGSLPLTVAAGLDIPYYWYEMKCLDRQDFPRTYRTGVYARNWAGERYWLPQNLAALKRPDRGLLTVPPSRIFTELANIPLFREYSDTFGWDDLMPALREMTGIGHSIFAHRLPRSRSLHRMSRMWRIRQARSAIFVCHGNICRSPAAAALAENCGFAEIASGGTDAMNGSPSPQNAVLEGRRLGIDLSSHSATRVDSEMLGRFDLIIVFDARNRRRIQEIAPDLKSRVVSLGAFCGGPFDIEDPDGGSPETFRQCYARIREALGTIARLRRGRQQFASNGVAHPVKVEK